MATTSSKDAPKDGERPEFRLTDPAGQPWNTTDPGEAVTLVSQGYRLVSGDLGITVPTGPADGPTATAPGTSPTSAPSAGDTSGPPPKSGAGSGRDAWAEYATARGVAVPDGAGRDDIVAALDAAGVPTEASAS